MKKGDKVTPVCKAGLWLADVPLNGKYKQKRKDVCAFKGVGTILKIETVVINYDEWDRLSQKERGSNREESLTYQAGSLTYRNVLIKCDAGTGWAGEGAVTLTYNIPK